MSRYDLARFQQTLYAPHGAFFHASGEPLPQTPLTPALVPSLFSVERWARFIRGLNNANLNEWVTRAPALQPAYAQVVKTEGEYRKFAYYRKGGSVQGWRE